LLVEQGEEFRDGSMAHRARGRDPDAMDDDRLIAFIIHEKDDNFRGRLKGLL
jgi:hypothetical protein